MKHKKKTKAELIKAHGTKEEFALAVLNAIPEISVEEAMTAIRKYIKEYNNAYPKTEGQNNGK